MNTIARLNAEQLKKNVADFRSGDTVRVHQLIQEGGKERVQIFEGVVIARDGGGINETFTVRKVSYNVGVERIFPLNSPKITKIEIKQRGHVRRGRLYYLRGLRGKAARIQQRKHKDLEAAIVSGEETPLQDEVLAEDGADVAAKK